MKSISSKVILAGIMKIRILFPLLVVSALSFWSQASGRGSTIDEPVPQHDWDLDPQEDKLYPHIKVMNTYPFSLPQDEERALSVCYDPTIPLEEVVRAEQLFLEDGDFSRLEGLRYPTQQKFYGIHYYGKAERAAASLGSLSQVFRQWDQPHAPFCKHLDFSIAGLGEGALKDRILNQIAAMLSLPSLRLDTLSLRWMNVTSEELALLLGVLERQAGKKPLKRLILSFNNLEDDVFQEGGILTRLIENVEGFKDFFVLDVRGNRIVSPERWGLARAVLARGRQRPQPLLRLGYNQREEGGRWRALSEEMIRGHRARVGNLVQYANFDQPGDMTQNVTDALKSFYDERPHPEGGIFRASYTSRETAYKNIADLILMFQNGIQISWREINLGGLRLNGTHLIELLEAVQDKPALRELSLRETLADPHFDHAVLAATIQEFGGLTHLSLAENPGFIEGGDNRVFNCYARLSHYLPLVRLTLEGLGLGSHGAENPLPQTLRFIETLGADMGRHLRHLSLAENRLSLHDLPSLIQLITFTKDQLTTLDLSRNWLNLDSMEGEERTDTFQFFEALEGSRRLCWVDLSAQGAGMTSEVAEGILARYRGMSAALASTHPVIRMNGRLPDGSLSEMREEGSGQGFLRLAQSYEANLELYDRYNQEAIVRAVRARIPDVLRRFKDDLPFREDELPAATAETLSQARLFFMSRELPLNDADVRLYARWILYRDTDESLFLLADSIRINGRVIPSGIFTKKTFDRLEISGQTIISFPWVNSKSRLLKSFSENLRRLLANDALLQWASDLNPALTPGQEILRNLSL